MKMELQENFYRIIILDISGLYAQIYEQGYFDKNSTDNILAKYSDKNRWQVIIVE